MPHTKLKRSDAPLAQSPKTRRRTAGGNAQIGGNTYISDPARSAPAAADRVVYTTSGPVNSGELLSINMTSFESDAAERGYHVLNGRITIRRDDLPGTVREKEKRNLARLLFQIAVLRVERESIPLHNDAEIRKNIVAEKNLVFTEAERWGGLARTLEGSEPLHVSQRDALPRSSYNFTQESVIAFTKSPEAIRAIGGYMQKVKSGKTHTKAIDVMTAAAQSAEELAMSVCPSGNLRYLTTAFRAISNDAPAANGDAKPKCKKGVTTPAARIQRATMRTR